MKWKITKEWLEKRARLGEETDVSTGSIDLKDLIKETSALRQTPSERRFFATAFGTLLFFLRHQRRLSLLQLAQKIDVDETDLEKIESDPDYTPEPRTVLQLANAFAIPTRKMLELAGLIITEDPAIRDSAVRFAASGKSLEKLTVEQQDALKEFVKYLANQK